MMARAYPKLKAGFDCMLERPLFILKGLTGLMGLTGVVGVTGIVPREASAPLKQVNAPPRAGCRGMLDGDGPMAGGHGLPGPKKQGRSCGEKHHTLIRFVVDDPLLTFVGTFQARRYHGLRLVTQQSNA